MNKKKFLILLLLGIFSKTIYSAEAKVSSDVKEENAQKPIKSYADHYNHQKNLFINEKISQLKNRVNAHAAMVEASSKNNKLSIKETLKNIAKPSYPIEAETIYKIQQIKTELNKIENGLGDKELKKALNEAKLDSNYSYEARLDQIRPQYGNIDSNVDGLDIYSYNKGIENANKKFGLERPSIIERTKQGFRNIKDHFSINNAREATFEELTNTIKTNKHYMKDLESRIAESKSEKEKNKLKKSIEELEAENKRLSELRDGYTPIKDIENKISNTKKELSRNQRGFEIHKEIEGNVKTGKLDKIDSFNPKDHVFKNENIDYSRLYSDNKMKYNEDLKRLETDRSNEFTKEPFTKFNKKAKIELGKRGGKALAGAAAIGAATKAGYDWYTKKPEIIEEPAKQNYSTLSKIGMGAGLAGLAATTYAAYSILKDKDDNKSRSSHYSNGYSRD